MCLAAGSYGTVNITGVTPASTVTLAAVNGAKVTIDDLNITGATQNLTVEGITFTGTVYDMAAVAGGVVFQYNTSENIGDFDAYHFYAHGSGGTGTQSGISMLYNQMDHLGECLEVDGGDSMEKNFTFSHNVCGPDLGAGYTDGSSGPEHYIEVGCVAGITVNNNAFEGPYNPSALKLTDAGAVHNNAFHCFGSGSNITVDNNIFWHTQSRAQTILIQEGQFTNVDVSNNLFVQDPGCENNNCPSQDIEIYTPHGMTVENNTVANTTWGLHFPVACTNGCNSQGTNETLLNNIVTSAGTDGNGDFADWNCSSTCTTGDNVSFDGTAIGAGSVTNWTPQWQTTSWTPASGSPYVAPPAGYYQPVGLSVASAGYQGSVGP